MQLGMALRQAPSGAAGLPSPPRLSTASKRPFWNVNWKHRLQPLAPLPAACQPPHFYKLGGNRLRTPPLPNTHTWATAHILPKCLQEAAILAGRGHTRIPEKPTYTAPMHRRLGGTVKGAFPSLAF